MKISNTDKYYREIVGRLEGVYNEENKVRFYSGVLKFFMIFPWITALVVFVESVFLPGSTGRLILLSSFLLTAFALLAWYIIRPFLYLVNVIGRADYHAIAAKVGNYFPEIQDGILNAMQLYESRDTNRNIYSEDLIYASVADLYSRLGGSDFILAVDKIIFSKLKKMSAITVTTVTLLAVSFPSFFFGSWYRVVNYNKSFATLQQIQFFVEPGNLETLRGNNVPITIRTNGKELRNMNLSLRQAGQEEFETQRLLATAPGLFQSEISAIKATTEYYASASDNTSDVYKITVLDRPLIRLLKIRISPPQYTRIAPKYLDDNTGDFSAYPGSTADYEITASKDISSAALVFSDSTTLPLDVGKESAAGTKKIDKNSTYHILLHDKTGLTNLEPIEYSISIVRDEYPTVEILSPGRNLDLTEQMNVALVIRIKDDFGFTKLNLAYRLAKSKYEIPAEDFSMLEIPVGSNTQNPSDITFSWDLTSLSLVPEDVMEYYAELFDNDNIGGPKSSKSGTFFLRLPSLEEVFSDVSESHQETFKTMNAISEETEQLQKEIEDLQRDMKKSRDKMSWQQMNKSEQMLQRYDAIKKKLEETSETLDSMVDKMDENKLLSGETMEKYRELQKLMEELKKPELQDALNRMREMMKQVTPDQMKSAMERLKSSEEQFRENLERTIELLKRIHIEQKLDELLKRTEEILQQQKFIKEQTKSADPKQGRQLDDMTRKQDELQKQYESLQKEIADLKQKMEEFPKEMPVEEMSKVESEISRQQTGQKMNRASSQIQSGDLKNAEQNQQGAEDDLTELKDQLEKARNSMRQKQLSQIVNQMRRQLENMIELSKREEEMKDITKSLDPNSQLFRESAQEQNETMSDLSKVLKELSEIGKKSFAITPEMGKELGAALGQMSEAMKQMEYRNPAGTSQKQGEAMGSLNRAAMMMQGTLNSMMQGGNKSGMGMAGLMASLQQAAGSQGMINQGTQQAMALGGQGQGGMLSAQQQAQYQRLAGQQAALQKTLEQLSAEAKNTGDYSRLLGDLDKIANEMKEVQTDLRQGAVNPNTVQKQDRILSRLLESTKSMRERDFEKFRRAESGRNITRKSPSEFDPYDNTGKDKLYDEMLKVLEGKYSKDYENLIRKYFEQLEKEDKNN